MDENNSVEIEDTKKEKKEKKGILIILFYIISLLLFMTSGYYAITTIVKNNKSSTNPIQVGEVKMDLINNEDTNIKLLNAYPMEDSKARELEPFEFKITNNGTLAVVYRLRLENVPDEDIKDEIDTNIERIKNDKINYSLIDSETQEVIQTGTVSNLKNQVLITEKLLPRYSKSFEFRIWLNTTAGDESANKFYAGRIVLDIDEILEEEE